VRAGGIEIGHLAAPPRTAATVEGAARNVARAARRTGARPLLENVASLIDPPGSDMDESQWLLAILDATGCDLLLDLHNLHANATNFGFDAHALVAALPAERIRAVHLAGGRPLAGRILDDHLHAVPDAVYALLETLGRHAAGPLTVVLERDGNYPEMSTLLAEIDTARPALRRRRIPRGVPRRPAGRGGRARGRRGRGAGGHRPPRARAGGGQLRTQARAPADGSSAAARRAHVGSVEPSLALVAQSSQPTRAPTFQLLSPGLPAFAATATLSNKLSP
jgi:hypothetical protein